MLTPRAADGVRIEIDGTAVGGGGQYRIDAVPMGKSSLVITLSDPEHGARTYSFELQRGGSQRAYLKASNSSKNAAFGRSVALHGDVLVTGASGDDSDAQGVGGAIGSGASSDSGAAYVFVRRGGKFEQLTMIKPDLGDPGDGYGFAVALDGDTIVVGADAEDGSAQGADGDANDDDAQGAGAVYVVR